MGEVTVQTSRLVFPQNGCISWCIQTHTCSPTFTYMRNIFISGFVFKVLTSVPLTILLIYISMSSKKYVQAASTIAWAGCPKCLENGFQIKSHQKKYYSLPFCSSTSRKEIFLCPGVNCGTEKVCAWKLGNPAAPLILFLLSHSAEQHSQKQNKLTSTKFMARQRSTQYKADLHRV